MKITLHEKKGVMQMRRNCAVVRAHFCDTETNREEHIYGKLLLFLPWRSEDELLHVCSNDPLKMAMCTTCKSYENKYISVKQVVDTNMKAHFKRHEEINAAYVELRENGITETAWCEVAPMLEIDNVDTQGRCPDIISGENLENAFQDTDKHSTSEETITLGLKYTIEANKAIMSTKQYKAKMSTLNDEQRKIVMYNRQWCKQAVAALNSTGIDIPAYRVFLSGPGGTGKSHVIELINRDVKFYFSKVRNIESGFPVVLLTAPTGTAAFNIGGMTIHSALQMGYNKEFSHLSQEKIEMLRLHLKHLKLLICDEASMIDCKKLRKIHERLCMIKKADIAGSPFANVSILLVGDLYQLPPVCGSPIYRPLPRRCNSVSDLSPTFWEDFLFHELNQIMRQKDHGFAMLLNSIRQCQPRADSDEDMKLKAREITVDEDDPQYPHQALHVYATNMAARKKNDEMLARLDGQLYINVATDSVTDKKANIAQIIPPDDPQKTGRLMHTLQLKVGARVMLTNNIDVSDGLTNGAMGSVTHVICQQGRKGIEVILVKFDSENVGINAKGNSPYKDTDSASVPIKRWSTTFTISGRISCSVSQSQFPLYLCWAVTIHKTQGLTVDEIVVNMQKKNGRFQEGQAYVALSRVKTYEKLHIVGYTRERIIASTAVNDEMQCLRQRPLTFEDFCTWKSDKVLTIAHQNVDGLLRNKYNIKRHENLISCNVVCITESKLDVSDSVHAEIMHMPDGQIFCKDQDCNGGSVLICVPQKYEPHQLVINSPIEVVGALLQKPINIAVLCVYKPPHFKSTSFAKHLSKIVQSLSGLDLCITGDFNENLLEKPNGIINQTLCNMHFKQHVNTVTTDKGTLIDHIYTNIHNSIDSVVKDCHYSDHDTTICAIHLV